LIAIEIILKQAGIPTKRNVLLTEIRNTSLISELKKERERTMDEFGISHGEEAKKLHEYMRGEP
jgi:hypothetical protein